LGIRRKRKAKVCDLDVVRGISDNQLRLLPFVQEQLCVGLSSSSELWDVGEKGYRWLWDVDELLLWLLDELGLTSTECGLSRVAVVLPLILSVSRTRVFAMMMGLTSG
jgi:hypothetical protein